jgi:hypothetical protein
VPSASTATPCLAHLEPPAQRLGRVAHDQERVLLQQVRHLAAGGDVVADLDRPPLQHGLEGRLHLGPGEIEPGLVEVGPALLELGLGLGDLRLGLELPLAQAAGRVVLDLALRHPGLALAHLARPVGLVQAHQHRAGLDQGALGDGRGHHPAAGLGAQHDRARRRGPAVHDQFGRHGLRPAFAHPHGGQQGRGLGRDRGGGPLGRGDLLRRRRRGARARAASRPASRPGPR